LYKLCFRFTEWAYLDEVGGLTSYGLPFNKEHAVPDKKLKQRTWPDPPQSPILRYMFRHFILEFPGLKDAPHKYWTKTIQPLFDDVASRYAHGSACSVTMILNRKSRNLPSSKERSEVTKRRTVAIALTNYFGTVYCKGLHPVTPSPECARAPARLTDSMFQKIDDLFPAPQTHPVGGLFVFVVKIDLVKMKTQDGEDKRVENYLICTRSYDNEKDIFVYRDYATFKKFDSDVSVLRVIVHTTFYLDALF
jgi:PX-associated